MDYNILYIEDLVPDSILKELESQGLNVTHHNPENFESTLKNIFDHKYDAIVIDFRLTSGKAIFDAPTIAQTIRTKNTKNHKFIPVFLISAEDVISDYYNDFTSHDLFDFSISKKKLLEEIAKYSNKIKSFVNAYRVIQESDFDLGKIFNLSKEKLELIDYRAKDKFKDDNFHKDAYAFSSFIYNEIIQSIGLLIGPDILSARLGISLETEGAKHILNSLDEYKYHGIFSDSYNRWWSADIEKWWQSNFKSSLRSFSAIQRTTMLKNVTGYNDLISLEPTKYSIGTNFWTICLDTKSPLDPLDGLELNKRELFPWQEKEYISIISGLQSSDSYKYVKRIDKERLRQINQNIKK